MNELERYLPGDQIPRGDAPWELVVRPRKLRLHVVVAAVLITLAHVAIGATLPTEKLPDGAGFTDALAFVLVGVTLSGVVLLVTRARVRVSADGVEVRNMTAGRFYPWAIVHGLRFPHGKRAARLELPDYEYQPMWAFQSNDGAHALAAVKAFRALEAKYMPLDD